MLALFVGAEDFAPLKVIQKMNKLYKTANARSSFTFLGGWYGKEWKDAEYVSQLASIPSKEELLGKLLFLLKTPVQSLAAVLDKIAEKKAAS